MNGEYKSEKIREKIGEMNSNLAVEKLKAVMLVDKFEETSLDVRIRNKAVKIKDK